MLSNTRSLGLDLEHSTRSLITIDRTEVVINLNIAKKVEAIQKTIKKKPKIALGIQIGGQRDTRK